MTTSGIVSVYTSKSYIGKTNSLVAKVKYCSNLNLDHGSTDQRLITEYEGHPFSAVGMTILKDGRCVLISALADELDNPMKFVPDEIAFLITYKQAVTIIDMTSSSHILELPKFKFLSIYHENSLALLQECEDDEAPLEMPMELVKLLASKKDKLPKRKGPHTKKQKIVENAIKLSKEKAEQKTGQRSSVVKTKPKSVKKELITV